jgi:hypothetical protein
MTACSLPCPISRLKRREEAHSLGIRLMDGRDLYRAAAAVRRTKPCEVCREPMVLDRSTTGWRFVCPFRTALGSGPLGGDPARAVELLTEIGENQG